MKTMLGGFASEGELMMSARIANEIIPVAAPRIRSRRVIECLFASNMRPHFSVPIASCDCDQGLAGCESIVTIARSTFCDMANRRSEALLAPRTVNQKVISAAAKAHGIASTAGRIVNGFGWPRRQL